MRDSQYDQQALEKAGEFAHKIAIQKAKLGTKIYRQIFLRLYWPGYSAAFSSEDEFRMFCSHVNKHGWNVDLPEYEPPLTQNEIAWQELVAILRSGLTQGIFAGVIGTAALVVLVKQLIKQLRKN